jgi:hypothetical protein
LSQRAFCVAIFAALLTFLLHVRHYGLFGWIAPSETKEAQKEITPDRPAANPMALDASAQARKERRPMSRPEIRDPTGQRLSPVQP